MEVTEQSVPEAADEREPASEPGPPGRAKPAIRWVAALAVVAALVGAGSVGWLLFQQHQKEMAGRQALEAAQKYVVALANIDSNALDDKFNDILNGSTGEFKDMYGKAHPHLRQVLADNQASARGTVVEATVKSASTNKVVILMFVDQTVSNVANPHPTIERSRIKMTMEKVDGRWLTSKVQLL